MNRLVGRRLDVWSSSTVQLRAATVVEDGSNRTARAIDGSDCTQNAAMSRPLSLETRVMYLYSLLEFDQAQSEPSLVRDAVDQDNTTASACTRTRLTKRRIDA